MTRAQKQRIRGGFEICFACAIFFTWIYAELYCQSVARVVSGMFCIMAALYFGWRLEHRVTLLERYDKSWTAIYGKYLLKNGGADRLLAIFNRFFEQRDKFDDYGRSKVLLADDVASEIPKARRDKKAKTD